jgi:hypothetical protein
VKGATAHRDLGYSSEMPKQGIHVKNVFHVVRVTVFLVFGTLLNIVLCEKESVFLKTFFFA